jgi:hypothetical protein
MTARRPIDQTRLRTNLHVYRDVRLRSEAKLHSMPTQDFTRERLSRWITRSELRIDHDNHYRPYTWYDELPASEKLRSLDEPQSPSHQHPRMHIVDTYHCMEPQLMA